MERITLPNAPIGLSPMDACLDYSFGDGKFARVILEMVEDINDHFRIKAQAYEMTADGNYAPALKGYPSRTKQTNHTVARSSFTARTATLAPGWIILSPTSQTVWNPESLPEGCTVVESLPATGTPGQQVYLDPNVWGWSIGVARQIAESKVEELEGVLINAIPLSNLGFDHAAL